MAARIGSLYVDLIMNSRGFVQGMSAADSATARSTDSIRRNVGLTQRSVDRLNTTMGRRSFNASAVIAASRSYEHATDRVNLLRGSLFAATAAAGGFAAALGTNIVSRYADANVNLNNQLRTVTTSSANLLAVQEQLEGVAQRSRSSLQSTVTLYARTARATETLGLSQERLLRITETIQKAFSIGGATAAEAQGAAIQLSQGIASDRFSGEEFRSVAENAPVLLRGMAESLGVNIGKLREMAHAGELTADVVTKAILKASTRIEEEFGQTVISLERAFTHVDNQILKFIGNTDQAYGVTALLSSGIVSFGDNLDRIIPSLTTVAGLIGAVFLARNKGAVGGGLGALVGGLAGSQIGGIEGAVFGAVAGGALGFGSTRRDDDGLGVIGRIKDDAATAKQRVVDLTEAQGRLREEVLASGRAYHALRAKAGADVVAFAPKSALGEVAREEHAIQGLDQKKLDLIQQQQDAYRKLGQVNAQITPKAAKLVDTQLKGEARVNDLLAKQASLRTQILGVGADRRARAAIEGRAVADSPNEVKERIRLERELASTVASTQRAQAAVSERAAKIAALSADADRKAAGERLVIGRQIMAQTAEMNVIDQERAKQVAVLGQARVKAELAGAAVAKQGLDEAGRGYRALTQAMKANVSLVSAATRAASPLAVGLRAVGREAGNLVSLFGGPWGVAITAASVAFAAFAADAQRRAQAIAAAQGLIREVLEEQSGTGSAGASSLIESEVSRLDTNIKTVRDGAAAAADELERMFNTRDRGGANVLDQMTNTWESIMNLPIQRKVDELVALTDQFIAGEMDVFGFRDAVATLKDEADSARFDAMADRVLELTGVIKNADTVVGSFQQQISDLREEAQNPINILINTTFQTLEAQPINAPLSNALVKEVANQNFSAELEAELQTLRLTGDARKRAEYTAAALADAEKAGADITNQAVKDRIAAYVDERIALDARDAALKASAKDNPFEKAVANLKERAAAQQLENQLIGQSTYAIERAKAVRDLENAAIEAKIKLTPELYSAILTEADAYATAAQAAEDLADQSEKAKERADFYRSTFSGFFIDAKNAWHQSREALQGLTKEMTSAFDKDSGIASFDAAISALKSSIESGSPAFAAFRQQVDAIVATDPTGLKEVGDELKRMAGEAEKASSIWGILGNAAANALDKIADRLITMGANGLFDMLFGAIGGAFAGPMSLGLGGPGFLGGGASAWAGFAGGGYTGPGTRLEPAGIVHRGEYVFDAATVRRLGIGYLDGLRGYANGGFVGPSMPMPVANSYMPASNDNRRYGDVHFHAQVAANSEAEGAAAARGFQAEMRRWTTSGEGAAFVRKVVNNPGRANP